MTDETTPPTPPASDPPPPPAPAPEPDVPEVSAAESEQTALRERAERAEADLERARSDSARDSTAAAERLDKAERDLADAQARTDAPTPSEPPAPGTDERAVADRRDADFYCPGCGRGFRFPAECFGASPETPHAPIQTVSTDELTEDADPANHTAAPDTGI